MTKSDFRFSITLLRTAVVCASLKGLETNKKNYTREYATIFQKRLTYSRVKVIANLTKIIFNEIASAHTFISGHYQ